MPAPFSGKIVKFLVADGEKVTAKQKIYQLDKDASGGGGGGKGAAAPSTKEETAASSPPPTSQKTESSFFKFVANFKSFSHRFVKLV